MVEYFSAFPTLVNNDGDIMKNITIRLDFMSRIKNNASIFQYIQISTGQRPEDIANIYYQDPTLYWVVLWMNDIVDPYYEWLLTDDQLYANALQKYSNIYATHHYQTITGSPLGVGIIVNQDTAYSEAISNIAYEQTQNELKRNIKILQPQYIPELLAEYQAELTGS